MGIRKDLDWDKFPVQGSMILDLVKVVFHYDTSRSINGVVIRDDAGVSDTFILCEDGRLVSSNECQFSRVSKSEYSVVTNSSGDNIEFTFRSINGSTVLAIVENEIGAEASREAVLEIMPHLADATVYSVYNSTLRAQERAQVKEGLF